MATRGAQPAMQMVLHPNQLRAGPHPALVPLQGVNSQGKGAGDRIGCSVAAQGSPPSSGAHGRSHGQEPLHPSSLLSQLAGELGKALAPDTIWTAHS